MKHTYLFISTALVMTLAACGSKRESRPREADAPPAARVRVQPISAHSGSDFEEVVGTVRSRLRATLEAKVSGQIAELPVVLGQQVQAGALVARLNAPEIKARLDAAAAGLAQVEREWKRVSALFEQQAATRAEYESVESRRRVAQASVAEAKAMMGYVEVRAPFAGRISRKHAERGDLATPGKPLVDLEDPAALELEAWLPETLAGSVQLGASLSVRPENEARPIEGKVSELAPSADPMSRTLLVRVELPGSAAVRPGQFARLLVPVGKRQSQRVPVASVVHRGQLDLVFTVEDQIARLRLVRMGRITGDYAEILSGLPESGTVVTEGASQLTDGQPVIVE